MMLEGIRIREVNGMLLVRVFGDIGEMEAESLAKTTELDFTLMFETEFEGLLGNLL